MNVAVNLVIHVLTVSTVLGTCWATMRYIRRSRAALETLIGIFRQAVETASIVAETDREDLRRLIRNVEVGVAGVQRLEAAGVIVADDLADAHRRADSIDHTDPPGTAADAAGRSAPSRP